MEICRKDFTDDPSLARKVLITGFGNNPCPCFITDFSSVLDLILLPKEAAWKMVDNLIIASDFPLDGSTLPSPREIVLAKTIDADSFSRFACYASLLESLADGRSKLNSLSPDCATYLRKKLLDVVVRLVDLQKERPSSSVFTSRMCDHKFYNAGIKIVDFLGYMIQQWLEDPEAFMKA